MTALLRGGRGVGKTMRLLEKMLLEEDSIYIAATEQRAEHAFNMAVTILKGKGEFVGTIRKQGLRKRFISANAYHHRFQGVRPRKTYVDDIEDVIERFLGIRPAIITTSLAPENVAGYID